MISLNNQLKLPRKLAVAWSGGADSTALLLLLLEQGYEVQAWHVDHGWNMASSQNVLLLSQWAKKLGIDFYSLNIKKPTENIEAKARQDRYACFEQMAKQTRCYELCLGHHADDQAETVCMRMLQGSGVAGCQGIKLYREHGVLHVWRPLLHVSRQDIEQYLLHKNIAWLSDPSNEDVTLWRNKIRHQLFPKMKSHGVNPQTLFLRWQEAAVSVQQYISHLSQGIEVRQEFRSEQMISVVDWVLWCEQTASVRVYVLQQMIGLLFADGRVFGRRHILAIEQWKVHGGHGWLNLSGCCLYKQGKSLQLCQGKTSLRDKLSNNVG